MNDLKSIKFWLFDLDNTLYSGKTKVFEQIDKKMSKYISKKLNVDIKEAKEIQKSYFYQYNTTLNGLVKNHVNRYASCFDLDGRFQTSELDPGGNLGV